MSHCLNQNELARRWKLSPRTLERWRTAGKGPAFLKLVGKVAYRLDDIDAYESECRQTQHQRRPRSTGLRPFAGSQPHLGR